MTPRDYTAFRPMTWLRWSAFAVALTVGVAALQVADWLEGGNNGQDD
jgi:hypothetical protein